MVDIKDRLREALDMRQMTAAELSRKSGIDKGSISNYLKGKFLPKQSAISAMANALNVSPSWLMGYDVPYSITETIDLSKLNDANYVRLVDFYKMLIELQRGQDNE